MLFLPPEGRSLTEVTGKPRRPKARAELGGRFAARVRGRAVPGFGGCRGAGGLAAMMLTGIVPVLRPSVCGTAAAADMSQDGSASTVPRALAATMSGSLMRGQQRAPGTDPGDLHGPADPPKGPRLLFGRQRPRVPSAPLHPRGELVVGEQETGFTGPAASGCVPSLNLRKGMAMTIVEDRRAITGGVGTHADVHVAAALDPIGGLLGVQEFPATGAGYAGLLGWLAGFGTVALAGIEGTGSQLLRRRLHRYRHSRDRRRGAHSSRQPRHGDPGLRLCRDRHLPCRAHRTAHRTPAPAEDSRHASRLSAWRRSASA